MATVGGASSPVDPLQLFFLKADHDLRVLRHKLELELEQVYPDNANPLKLLKRIKAIQEELPSLRDLCEKLLAAKQGLIDKAQSMLIQNRASLQRMHTYLNIPVVNDSDDPVYSSFQMIIGEWNQQFGIKSYDTKSSYKNGITNDVNQSLFSSKINEN